MNTIFEIIPDKAIGFIYLTFLLFLISLHIACAWGVFCDSIFLKKANRNTVIVSPCIWTLGTLLGGIYVLGVYWLLHHSTLRYRDKESEKAQNTQTSNKKKTIKKKDSIGDIFEKYTK